jgi:hypothetical protein
MDARTGLGGKHRPFELVSEWCRCYESHRLFLLLYLSRTRWKPARSLAFGYVWRRMFWRPPVAEGVPISNASKISLRYTRVFFSKIEMKEGTGAFEMLAAVVVSGVPLSSLRSVLFPDALQELSSPEIRSSPDGG